MPKLSDYFERKTRDNGERFYTLRDDAPGWLLDAVREAHCGDMPNDWTWEECYAACEAIDSERLDDDSMREHCDGRVDIYTNARFQWAADHCNGSLFAEGESRAGDLGCKVDGQSSIVDALGAVQFGCIEHVAGTILRAWMDASEDPATEPGSDE